MNSFTPNNQPGQSQPERRRFLRRPAQAGQNVAQNQSSSNYRPQTAQAQSQPQRVDRQPDRRPNQQNFRRNAPNNFARNNNRTSTMRRIPNESSQLPAPVRQILNKAGTQGVRIVYLGGLGEIGKNMMAIESGNDIIILDCGVMFPKDDMLGVDLVIPDVRYLEERKQFVRAYFLTHGHEDHISGLPFIWPRIPAPVYGTKLTLAFLQAKLEEHGLDKQVDMRTFKPGDKIQAGVFTVEPIHINHSIPDAVALAVKTPEGIIIDTGDWKVDYTPVSGLPIDVKRLSELGQEGVLLLMSESTNAEVKGYTKSESELTDSLEVAFSRAQGRIIVASFASLINRIQQVFDITVRHNRKIALFGRSLERNVTLAIKHGYLRLPDGILVDSRQINRLQDEEVVIMATGSQGEEFAALNRMSTGDHRFIKIKPGDTVILSSKVIPGNEQSVIRMMNDLYREGADVINEKDIDVHVSGHAGQEELKFLINLVKPKFFVPIHGDFRFLVKHARLAQMMGVEPKNIFVAEDGDFVEIVNGQGKLIQNHVESSYVLVDGSGIGDVGNIVLRDRQAMAKDGVLMVVLTVDHKTGKLLTSPDIISRGFVYMRAAEDLIHQTRQEVKNLFARSSEKNPTNWEQIKRSMRDDLGEFLFNKTQRKPMVIPVIVEV